MTKRQEMGKRERSKKPLLVYLHRYGDTNMGKVRGFRSFG